MKFDPKISMTSINLDLYVKGKDLKGSSSSLEKHISKVYNLYNNSPTSNNINSRNFQQDEPGESGETILNSDCRNIKVKAINGEVR